MLRKRCLDIPAANRHSPITKNIEYPVTLPDNAFVIASISIYVSREINEDGLTYGGRTHASILSLKHDKADSYAGLKNLNFILGLDYFKLFLKQNNGDLKLLLVFTREGHDVPRFPTPRRALIMFFQENDIDFIVAVSSAAGLSACQFTER